MTKSFITLTFAVLCAVYLTKHVNACRVNSEKFKSYAKKSIERLLDAEQLESFYWSEEPLNEIILSKATGLNITLAETQFELEVEELPKGDNHTVVKSVWLREIFVTCSADRDRSFTVTLNLEIANPFNTVSLYFKKSDNSNEPGLFRIHLPQSTLFVQLNQKISYDECLEVNYVQLAPSVNYVVECLVCTPEEQDHVNKVFSKRMTHLDNEIDSMISEKLLLGLQMLLSQQRLDLDLYLN